MHSVLDNVEHIFTKPYPYMCMDKCLPQDYYNELAAARPDWKRIARDKAGKNNVRVDMHSMEIISNADMPMIWREFVSFHTSQEFFKQWCRVFAPLVNAYYPWLEWALGKPLNQCTVSPRSGPDADLYLECQLSVNTPVTKQCCTIGPHLDNPEEIYGSMLYMNDGDQEHEGVLEIYNTTDKPHIYGKRLIDNPGEVVHFIPYRANRYIGFINSPYSVHGVSKRNVTDRARLMVNLSLELCDSRKALFNPEIYR